MQSFNYHKPSSVAEAKSLLAGASDGTLMAGGMTLLPTMKQRLAAPSDVIDIGGIAELGGISVDDDSVTIGAGVKHADVASSADVRAAIPGLAALAGQIGDAHVRHMGTIGGSVANNDPAADYPGACLALGATIVTSDREIAADDFFTGLFDTALNDGEIVTAVRFPKPARSAYAKFPNPASRYALVGVFVSQGADGGARVAITGAGQDGSHRNSAMEAALSGNFSSAALDGMSVDAGGMNADIHGSAEYRAHLCTVMAKRAVDAAG
jgi:carbon-monoxide dehydrogenase medium subunit